MPRSETHTFAPPLTITVPKPHLPVSSTLLDVPPPHIEQNFRYGDPASTSLPLSAETGFAGVGAAPHSSAAAGVNGANGTPSGSGPVFSLSQVSQPPTLLYKVEPDYSEQARLSRYNGTVLLRLVIDENGAPRDIRVVRSLGLGLDEKAIEAVRHWRFSPGLRDGKAVAVDANIEVNFQLL
jgi:periplasmic protein TonB